jgi:hypothetical protein
MNNNKRIMKTFKKILLIVTTNKVTIFIAKLLGMLCKDFNNGDVVCLTFDRGRKLLVESNVIIEGKIKLVFFNEDKGIIQQALIEPKYLAIDVIEGKRL